MKFFSKENKILLKEMVKTDFKLRYQGSLIGHLWSILKPLMLFTIMYLVFVQFLRFDDGTPHYAIGLLIGMVTWNFFSEATNMGMMSIVSRGDLLRKLNFSKENQFYYVGNIPIKKLETPMKKKKILGERHIIMCTI